MGFSDNTANPLKTAADAEKEFIGYMFSNAQEFLKLLITGMMDEPSTRQTITRIILKLNK